MKSIGCHVSGYAPPHPDYYDDKSMIAGVFKRVAREIPRASRNMLRGLRRFVKKWLKKNLIPLSSLSDVTLETWLKDTSYPDWRKKELKAKWIACDGILQPFHYWVKSFMKDETYDEINKQPRGINARTDEFKCKVGPVFKAIEHVIYKHPAFIKNVPVRDRPSYIRRLLPHGTKYMATDYTAYESHFTNDLMQSCEFELYRYMTQYIPGAKEFSEILNNVLGGLNKCIYKNFTLYIKATRMSGEMNTSLGNGFSNLMCMLYLCKCNKCKNVYGVVEGDDGLFTMVGPPPTADQFASIGLTIKIDMHDRLETASFCGIVFDEEDMINVTDPRSVLVNFGWTNSRYTECSRVRLLELLRAKSMSLVHQYPGCPIIQALGFYGMRVTAHIRMSRYLEKTRSLSMWEREQLLLALAAWEANTIVRTEPGMNTRFLVAKLYGISVDYQIQIETYLDSLTSIQPLNHYSFPMILSGHYSRYWQEYVREPAIEKDRPILGLKPYTGQLDRYAAQMVKSYAVSHGCTL